MIDVSKVAVPTPLPPARPPSAPASPVPSVGTLRHSVGNGYDGGSGSDSEAGGEDGADAAVPLLPAPTSAGSPALKV